MYPNVTITYEQNNGNRLVEYMKNNSSIDIVMVDTPNVRYADWNDSYIFDQLADLRAEDADVSAVKDEWLDVYTVDGKLVAVPMGLKMSGIVVNKTLLEKEGLPLPTNDSEFLYAPMADDGVCEFVEPWFGFAVSQNSDDYEYALEFLRFLAQEDQLNTLASVKGVPSATKNSSDVRYEGIQNAENVTARYVNDGTILNHVKTYFKQTASGLGNGDYATTEDAARDYVRRCAEVAAQMAENF